MGSFLIRQYLQQKEYVLAGVVLVGTAQQAAPKLWFGLGLTRSLAAVFGWRYRSKMVRHLAMGSYNRKCERPNTWADWISRDEEIVSRYVEDPWCIFKFTLNAYHQMFVGMVQLNKKNAAKVPPELPLLLVSGRMDPVSNYGRQLVSVAKIYKSSGHKNVTIKLYSDDRHEILNELDREQVFSDISRWMHHWVRVRKEK